MNFGSRQGHRAADVFNPNPHSCEIARLFRFGDDTFRALLHHLRNEFVRVKQLAAYGGKQSSGLRLTRIVRDIGDDGVGWTEHFSDNYSGNIGDCYWFVFHVCLEPRAIASFGVRRLGGALSRMKSGVRPPHSKIRFN